MSSQKILIVDDSKTIRMQVKDMLPVGRFEILEAKDGLEGLDLIQQEQPSLVLLDFFMPRMNGWEVVQKIQAQPRFNSIPVVMMSGKKADVEQTVPELFDYFEFISKPFDQKVLLGAIKSAMTKAKHRQPSPLQPMQSAATGRIGVDRNGTTDGTTIPTAELQALQATVRELQAQNVKLQAEVDGLKKQTAQILSFIRQRLK
jgi:CheY-like chemotaxis protein